MSVSPMFSTPGAERNTYAIPSSLELCPVELINEIAGSLDLGAICNLRLTCKTLAAKCSSTHRFRSFFKSKHVILTEQALRAFAEGTQAGGLCALVQEVTISASAIGDWPLNIQAWKDAQMSSRQNKILLLSQAFNGLARNGATGRLPSLSLGVHVPRGRNARQPQALRRFDPILVDGAAVDSFQVVFHALAETRLQVEALNIFNNAGHGFSVPYIELDKINWDGQGLTQCLTTVRSLSINIANRLPKLAADPDINWQQSPREHLGRDLPAAQVEGNLPGLARLFGSLQALESLKLTYFVCDGGLPASATLAEHERLLQDVLRSDSLPNLFRCKLWGICAREEVLLEFIKRTAVSELSLEYIHLSSGSFRPIFDYCTDAATSITKLDFDDLFERKSPHTLSTQFWRCFTRLS
jgi:hypothetical protein